MIIFSKLFALVLLFVCCGLTTAAICNSSSGRSHPSLLHGIEIPEHSSFNSVVTSTGTGCGVGTATSPKHESAAVKEEEDTIGQPTNPPLKLHLKHSPPKPGAENNRKVSLMASAYKDQTRIHTFHRRIAEQKNQNTGAYKPRRKLAESKTASEEAVASQLVATLESGVSLGSGEYFMDVFVGTPPKHFSLILDTGSDLNWIQCLPCRDCFEQKGPFYDPRESSSYRNVSCGDPRCKLVSPLDPHQPCRSENQTCEYFYWYGDQSNTTGDFALETFTVNLTSSSAGASELRRVENVMFGCGHWNRGLFHGAAGLLGLGRGPLSFSSQLQSLYGQAFSYCLVDRYSDLSVSSKLILGEDPTLMAHPDVNFTSFVKGKENPVDTFYYIQIKEIMVGGEPLDIPASIWRLSEEGAGGTIIDSGTTLSYFAEPANTTIKEAFVRKVRKYPRVDDFAVLGPCFNVSGAEKVEMPEFAIVFEDGAVWKFPMENYFLWLEPDEIMCLAVAGTPRSSLSILGNYQQQNFHILYDTKKSRLGFAPMNCAHV